MTWLAWRQLRTPALAGSAALAALAVLLLLAVARAASVDQLAGNDLVAQLSGIQRFAYVAGSIALIVAPAIIGVFWGAPLVAREFEAGTYRLVWTQTVGRARWLVTKLALGGFGCAAIVGLTSLIVSWWCAPIDDAIETGGDRGGLFVARVAPLVFDARGVVPIAHALFAFVLGVAIGVVIRRTLAAMGTTLLLLVVIMVATPILIRPHLLAPTHESVAIPVDTPVVLGDGRPKLTIEIPGTWQLSQRTVDAAGNSAAFPASFSHCVESTSANGVRNCLARLDERGFRQQLTYQPADHFWPLQWLETAIFLVLSLGLAGICARRITHA